MAQLALFGETKPLPAKRRKPTRKQPESDVSPFHKARVVSVLVHGEQSESELAETLAGTSRMNRSQWAAVLGDCLAELESEREVERNGNIWRAI